MSTSYKKLINDVVLSAVEEWKEINTPEKIRRDVFAELDKFKTSISMQLLGFRWDEWRKTWVVDATNGRDKYSFAGEILTQTAHSLCAEWVRSLPKPKLTPAQIKKLQKTVEEYMESLLRTELHGRVRDRLEMALDDQIEGLIDNTTIAQYLKARDLIQAP